MRSKDLALADERTRQGLNKSSRLPISLSTCRRGRASAMLTD